MDKILPILEKYVQWIALGIGALFLALMAYSYAVQAPVTVPLGGKQVAPSAVDPAIKSGPEVTGLKNAIESKSAGPPVTGVPPVASALQGVIQKPVPVPDIGGTIAKTDGGTKPPSSSVALPTIPKATYADLSNGWGLYQWSKWQPPPPAAPGAPAAAPGVVPFNPAAGVAAPLIQQEFGWWTGKFEVSMAKVSEAFKAAKLDPLNPAEFKSAFLGVELYRQEKQLDGKWGKEIKIAALPEYQPQMKDFPPEKASRTEKAAHMYWAMQNVVMLVQPPFPQVVAGDPWYPPGTPPPAKVNQNNPAPLQPPVPNGPPPGFVPGAAPAPPPRVPPRGNNSVLGPQRGTPYPVMLASGPAFGQPKVGSDVPRGTFAPPGSVPGFIPDGGPVAPGYNPGDTSTIPGASDPEGVFYPNLLVDQAVQGGLPDFNAVIYAHDITVQAGKTYQYRVKYFLRNPLFLMEGVKKEYADKLVLASDYSDWSKEYTVAARIEFWVNKINENRGVIEDAEFEVYVAGAAGWKPEKVKASPGDQIAKGEGNSGWALVDIRKSKDNKYEVVLTDTNGQLQRRDLQTDLDDPKRRERAGVPDAPPAGVGLEGAPAPVAPVAPGGRPPPRGFTNTPE